MVKTEKAKWPAIKEPASQGWVWRRCMRCSSRAWETGVKGKPASTTPAPVMDHCWNLERRTD